VTRDLRARCSYTSTISGPPRYVRAHPCDSGEDETLVLPPVERLVFTNPKASCTYPDPHTVRLAPDSKRFDVIRRCLAVRARVGAPVRDLTLPWRLEETSWVNDVRGLVETLSFNRELSLQESDHA
jgi:hypothetical protein